MNSSYYLDKHTRKNPGHYAVKTEYGHLTYLELSEQVNLFANGLITKGIKQQEKIILFMPNTLEFMISYLAIQKIGAIVVPINIKATLAEINTFIKHSNPSAIIIHHFNFNQVRELNSDILKIKTGKGNLYWHSFLEIINNASEKEINISLDENDFSSQLFTSSTKDIPRSALFDYRSLLTVSHMICAKMEIEQSSRIILMNSFNHTASFQLFFMGSIIAGATLIFRATFTPDLLIEAVESEQATHFFGLLDAYLTTGIKLQNKEANLSSVIWWIYEEGTLTINEKEFIKKQFETNNFVSITELTEEEDY
ncbi:MAG TPA: AMP-binding protein [Pseudogracilibacillus sp.]|nr:AMP-binding protein [Pseudogracilibacillus sp.]